MRSVGFDRERQKGELRVLVDEVKTGAFSDLKLSEFGFLDVIKLNLVVNLGCCLTENEF